MSEYQWAELTVDVLLWVFVLAALAHAIAWFIKGCRAVRNAWRLP